MRDPRTCLQSHPTKDFCLSIANAALANPALETRYSIDIERNDLILLVIQSFDSIFGRFINNRFSFWIISHLLRL